MIHLDCAQGLSNLLRRVPIAQGFPGEPGLLFSLNLRADGSTELALLSFAEYCDSQLLCHSERSSGIRFLDDGM